MRNYVMSFRNIGCLRMERSRNRPSSFSLRSFMEAKFWFGVYGELAVVTSPLMKRFIFGRSGDMKSSVLTWCMLAAGFMAFIYDKVEMATGMEIHVLLVGAITAMVVGLYSELGAKSKVASEEDSV